MLSGEAMRNKKASEVLDNLYKATLIKQSEASMQANLPTVWSPELGTMVTPGEYRKYKLDISKAKILSKTTQSELERSYERETEAGTFTDSFGDYVRQWKDASYRRFRISEERGEFTGTFPEFMETFPTGLTIGEKLEYKAGAEDIKTTGYLRGPRLRADVEKGIDPIELILEDDPVAAKEKLVFRGMENALKDFKEYVKVERAIKDGEIGWWITQTNGDKFWRPF